MFLFTFVITRVVWKKYGDGELGCIYSCMFLLVVLVEFVLAAAFVGTTRLLFIRAQVYHWKGVLL